TGHPVKSTNAGLAYAPLGNDPTGGDAWDIVADTGATNRVFVASYSQLYFSSNGGQTFTLKYTAATGNGLHIGWTVFHGSLMVLGTSDGLLVSSDAGVTLNKVPTPGIPVSEAIVSFAGAKTGSTIRLFCVTLGSADVYEGVQGDDYGNYKGVYTINWG